MTTRTRHPKFRPAHLGFQDLDDALRFTRYAAHEVAGLCLEVDSSGRFPLVLLGTSGKTATALFDGYTRGGRAGQEARDAAAGDGGWEE